jgi:asparagine synthase (glutamine-hydrolysing)
MADFLLTTSERILSQDLTDAMIVTSRAHIMSGSAGGRPFAVSRVDDPTMWFPAHSPEHGLTVILGGRIALSPHQWDQAERLPYIGGLAPRHLLDAWIKSRKQQIPEFNGAAVAIFLDASERIGFVRTDRIGCAPVFATSDSRKLVIGSHPDSVASIAAKDGGPMPIDEVTIGEFVRTGTSTHPHTYYRDLIQLDGASVYSFPLSGSGLLRKLETYWAPGTLNGADPAPRNQFVEALSEGLKTAGRLRSSARMGTQAVLLSAGADSRGVLCSLENPSEAHTYTYFDATNPELERAQEIARAAGVPHHSALQREPDYYVSNAEETIRLSGGMWSLDSGHHTGFVDEIWKTPNFGTLLTGCYADYLFKGLALNTKKYKLFKRSLPISKLSSIELEFYQPFTPLDQEMSMEVEARLTHRFEHAIIKDNRYDLEISRISPLCREADASGRLAMWRQFPIDPIMADSHILDAYGMQSINDKLSGIAFGQAVARVTGREVAAIPNNNYSAPVGTSEFSRVISFAGASILRKITRLGQSPKAFETSDIATYGSWPNLQAVLKQSELARSWFCDLRSAQFYGLLDDERCNWDYDAFVANDVVQLMRLLTVLIWRKSNFRS